MALGGEDENSAELDLGSVADLTPSLQTLRMRVARRAQYGGGRSKRKLFLRLKPMTRRKSHCLVNELLSSFGTDLGASLEQLVVTRKALLMILSLQPHAPSIPYIVGQFALSSASL